MRRVGEDLILRVGERRREKLGSGELPVMAGYCMAID